MGWTRRRTLIGLGAGAVLAGCGEEGAFAWKPETEAERELRLSRERLQRTVGEGGLTGVAAGAAIGALLGGPAGAFRGAELGRFAGAAAGAYVRQLQAEFAEEEAVLDRVVSDLRITNARLEQSIAAMQSVVAETRASAAVDATRLARNTTEAEATVEAAERQEAFFGATRSILQAEVAPVAGTGFDSEFDRLRTRIATLRAIAGELAGAS